MFKVANYDFEERTTHEQSKSYHISKLLQFRNIQKYVSENEEKIKNSGAEIIEESEIEEKITQVEALLTSEGYNTEKIYTKSIAKLAKEKQELFGVYISMYCEEVNMSTLTEERSHLSEKKYWMNMIRMLCLK